MYSIFCLETHETNNRFKKRIIIVIFLENIFHFFTNITQEVNFKHQVPNTLNLNLKIRVQFLS